MSLDLDKMADNFSKYLDSPEGKKSMDDYVAKIVAQEAAQERYVQKFKLLYENKLDEAIEKLLAKYDSDAYVNKEYKLGYEPREDLLWLVYNYVIKYCKRCKNPKYLNDFTGDAFYCGSYVIQCMHGQGSVIKIEKIYDGKKKS
jgi:hypothetical protein